MLICSDSNPKIHTFSLFDLFYCDYDIHFGLCRLLLIQ
ncbi:unnamed protein product, partial [Brassica oleracea]